jgi:hypothetical protein
LVLVRSTLKLVINLVGHAQTSGNLVTIYYSPRGQEVIPSALSVHLSNDDYVCAMYRGVHDMLANEVPFKLVWAEIAGRSTGTCKGKGGPMHVAHPESGVIMMVRATSARFKNWPRSGSYRWCSSARITDFRSTPAMSTALPWRE